MPRIPANRAPTHPGEMLNEEFLVPLGISQSRLALEIRVPFQRVNLIVNGKRAVTPDTALRLAKFFGTTPDFWLSLQLAWDVYQAMHAPEAKEIESIQPLKQAS
jgi:addiction module HigA family antidote